MSKKLNNIKETLKHSKLQVTALALYLDIDDTTLSKWNSNVVQPSLNRIDELGQILEVDNKELINTQPRKSTGLADALQVEYKKLLSNGLTKKIIVKDDNGSNKEINNPEMVKRLRNFAEVYKANNSIS